MTLSAIADVFSVSHNVIRQALKLHKISPRRPLSPGGYKVDFLRSLKINETRPIEWRDSARYIHLHDTANRIGMKISIKSLGNNRFDVTRLR